jgi:glutathione S-transferase
VITEAPAILAYVARAFPKAHLAPEGDAFALAQLESFAAYLCSWVHPAAAHRHRGYRWADDPAAIADMRRKAPLNFAEALDLIDRELFLGPWVLGDAYSYGDPYLYTVATWISRDGLDMADYPNIADHYARMEARPAVIAVRERVQAARVAAG